MSLAAQNGIILILCIELGPRFCHGLLPRLGHFFRTFNGYNRIISPDRIKSDREKTWDPPNGGNDVPRGTMDEVSLHVRLGRPFILFNRAETCGLRRRHSPQLVDQLVHDRA